MTALPTAQTVFVTAHVDVVGGKGGLLGGRGTVRTASGDLRAPGPGLVLWRVIERVKVEKGLAARALTPADDGQSVSYAYTVTGGGGGLFPIDEAGHFEAEIVAAFAPPSFLTEVGRVEIVSTSAPPDDATGGSPDVRRGRTFSAAQLEGRLIRLPDVEDSPLWFVERGVKRPLASPTVGRLRFGDGWQRLVQPLTSIADAAHVPDGSPLTLAEAAEGKLIYSWPAPETYWVQNAHKRRIDDPAPVIARFGDHWRIKLIHLRRPDLEAIPDGGPITRHDNSSLPNVTQCLDTND